jgi:glucokinase
MIENKADVNMILAGDVGGTKTLLGLFETGARPEPVVVRTYATASFADLTALVSAFVAEEPAARRGVTAAAFGIAGPVRGVTATLTNLPFDIDADAVGRVLGIPRVRLLNDLEAMARSLRVLTDAEVHPLQAGIIDPEGPLALVAAGTGFNEAVLHRVDGRDVVAAAEAGHADWAARSSEDITLLRDLVARFGRAEVENVLSGPGLVNVYRVTHPDGRSAHVRPDDPEAPAQITRAALGSECDRCVTALRLFVEAYGAEAGNLALRALPTGGLFVGGGIAPKILPFIDRSFMPAFLDKGAFRDLLRRVPVKVILNAEAGLLGAAVAAAQP